MDSAPILLWAVGSGRLDPTAGGGVRCTADRAAEILTVCGFFNMVFKCFNF